MDISNFRFDNIMVFFIKYKHVVINKCHRIEFYTDTELNIFKDFLSARFLSI
jgi:hypothetical protein